MERREETKIQFYKVSKELFCNDFQKNFPNYQENQIFHIYNNICLPKRATKASAGYDIYSPIDFVLKPKESIVIPTSIRVLMPVDIVFLIFPRSSLGFKYKLQLDNTVGVIDSDYYYSDNEGHIFVKITNNSNDSIVNIKENFAFAQGIFIKYYTTIDDKTTNIRNGGLGSTNENK